MLFIHKFDKGQGLVRAIFPMFLGERRWIFSIHADPSMRPDRRAATIVEG